MDDLMNILVGAGTGRDQLLNIYIGNENKEFVQLTGETPEGYDPTGRGWYKAAKEAKTTIVTDPYMDVLIGGMCVTVAAPIYINGNLYGVVGADYTLDTITEITNSAADDEGTYGFLADSSGKNALVVHDFT